MRACSPWLLVLVCLMTTSGCVASLLGRRQHLLAQPTARLEVSGVADPLVIGNCSASSSQEAAGGDHTYCAASVMHTPVDLRYGVPLSAILLSNLRLYARYLEQALARGAQIIVYPESGTGYLQVPHDLTTMFCEAIQPTGWAADDTACATFWTTNQSGATDPHATFASCAARDSGVDVVINFCARNGTAGRYYNVDAAFEAGTGRLLAVYLKSHITGTGPVLSQPARPDAVTFTSSFGKEFGLFTCYDFWFSDPQVREMAEDGVRDFLFPSEMASGPPYFSVTGAVAGWSHVHGVNVVGSASFGTGFVGAASGGTALETVQPMPANFTDAHAVLVQAVPWTPRRSAFSRPVLDKTANPSAERYSQSSVVSVEPSSTCTYGPPTNSLNFTYPCGILRQPRAGVRYELSASNAAAGYTVDCNATIIVADSDAPSNSSTWVFGAVLLVGAPNVGTPSALATAMCLFVRCPSPEDGCMTMDLYNGWATDLQVSTAAVTMQLGGGFTSQAVTSEPIGLYPIAVWSNGRTGRNNGADAIAMRPLNASELVLNVAGNGSYSGMYAFESTAGSVMRELKVWSFGMYADRLDRTLNATR